MAKATKAKYKKAARLHVSGMNQAESLVQAGVYTNLLTAKSNGHKVFRDNEIVKAEMKRYELVQFEEFAISKKEKLAISAEISRKLEEQILDQLEDEGVEVNTKLLAEYIKMGKRDDALQGHNIQAETNPQDKRDMLINDWVMESRKDNDENRIKPADVVDI